MKLRRNSRVLATLFRRDLGNGAWEVGKFFEGRVTTVHEQMAYVSPLHDLPTPPKRGPAYIPIYLDEEGIFWARGWKTDAARALRVAMALRAS